MDLEISCEEVDISQDSYNRSHPVALKIRNIRPADTEEQASDILDHIELETIIAVIGEGTILDEIGKEECISHFNIVEKED